MGKTSKKALRLQKRLKQLQKERLALENDIEIKRNVKESDAISYSRQFLKIAAQILNSIVKFVVKIIQQGVRFLYFALAANKDEKIKIKEDEKSAVNIEFNNEYSDESEREYDSDYGETDDILASLDEELITRLELDNDSFDDLDSIIEMELESKKNIEYISSTLKGFMKLILFPVVVVLSPLYFIFPKKLLSATANVVRFFVLRWKKSFIQHCDIITGTDWFVDLVDISFQAHDTKEINVLNFKQTVEAIAYCFKHVKNRYIFYNINLPKIKEVRKVFDKLDFRSQGYVTHTEFDKICAYIFKRVGFDIVKQTLVFSIVIPMVVICSNVAITSLVPISDTILIIFTIIELIWLIEVFSS